MDLTTATLQELREYKGQVEQHSDEYNMISNRIAELELTEQAEAKEMEVVSVEVAKFMDSLDFEGAEPKELFINYGPEGAEASYNYVNTVIQNAVVAMKKSDLQRIKELETVNANLTDKAALLSDDNERLSQDLYSKQLEISELGNRLKNAATQLDEERDEIARLNSQLDDLRKEIAVGAVAALQVVELDTRSAREKWLEQKQKEEDAKQLIHNIRWEDDLKRTHYLAELVETEETVRFSYMLMSGDVKEPTKMEGKYRVVTSEDATTFRNAYLAANSPQTDSDSGEQGSDLEEQVVTVPPFQNDSETEPRVAEEDTSVEVAGQAVERNEFTALQQKVDELTGEIHNIKSRLNL